MLQENLFNRPDRTSNSYSWVNKLIVKNPSEPLWVYSKNICGTLRDLVPFVQFKKREKHLWRSVNFSKVAG